MITRYLLCLSLILWLATGSAQVLTYQQDIAAYRSANWKSLIADPRTVLQSADSIFLHYYPVKEKNKVFCTVQLLDQPLPFDMPTYSGQVKSFRKYALLQFSWRGKPTQLTAYQSIQNLTSPLYKDYLFVPFKDKTTGTTTYAGGRYIDLKKQQIMDGHLLLDLNQVYNPWCAYDDKYNCPIPPIENSIPFPIKAGEKRFSKKH